MVGTSLMPPQHDAPEALVLAGAFTARAAGAGVFFSAGGTALLLPAQQQDVPEAVGTGHECDSFKRAGR